MKHDTIEETLSQSSLADHRNWIKWTFEILRGEKTTAQDQNKIKNKTGGGLVYFRIFCCFLFFLIDQTKLLKQRHFQYVKGPYKKARERLFTMICRDSRTRENGYKLKEGWFRLKIRHRSPDCFDFPVRQLCFQES